MGKVDVYLGIISIFVSISTASFAPKGHPVGSLADGIIAEYHPKSENDESNHSGPADENEPKTYHRVLQSGDTLTPPELLPLAKRLMTQVDTVPGAGKGIVSSAPSAEVLADTLFQAFFMKKRRIAELTKYDISGLDALQALALNGKGIQQNLKLVSVDGARCYVDELTYNGVVDNNMCYINGPEPRKSIYKLLTKFNKLDSVHENSIPTNRRKRETGVADKNVPESRIALINKLGKKRQLVVNTGRKHDNNNNNIKKKLGETAKGSYAQRNVQQANVATARPIELPGRKKANLKGCRWSFECSQPRDLDTCRLKTFCPNMEISPHDKEQERILRRVRRMIGISSVDEEVEKILEARALKLRPKESFRSSAELPRLPETLSQYFTSLIMRQVAKVEKSKSNGQIYEENKKNIGPEEKSDNGNDVSLDMVTSDEASADEDKSNDTLASGKRTI